MILNTLYGRGRVSVNSDSMPSSDPDDLDDDFSDFRGHKVVDEEADLPMASAPPQPSSQPPPPPAQEDTDDGV